VDDLSKSQIGYDNQISADTSLLNYAITTNATKGQPGECQSPAILEDEKGVAAPSEPPRAAFDLLARQVQGMQPPVKPDAIKNPVKDRAKRVAEVMKAGDADGAESADDAEGAEGAEGATENRKPPTRRSSKTQLEHWGGSASADNDVASVSSNGSSNSDVKSAALRRKTIQAWKSYSRPGSMSLQPSEVERPGEVSDAVPSTTMSAKSRRASLTAVQKWKDRAAAAKVASRRVSAGDVPVPKLPRKTRPKNKAIPPIKPRGDSIVSATRKGSVGSSDSNWLADYGEPVIVDEKKVAEGKGRREDLL